jgi:hypothetical protein
LFENLASVFIMERESVTRPGGDADKKNLNSHNYALELVVGLHVPEVAWYKHPGLRRLYLMMPILFLGSTINGYDGSLLNGLQTMDPWQECRIS